jgi:periodic tryptophan protein 2
VGNRVSVFDLVKSVTVLSYACANNQLMHSFHSNKSYTFPFQSRKNIAAIALSPNGNILICVDEGAVKALPVFIATTYMPQ